MEQKEIVIQDLCRHYVEELTPLSTAGKLDFIFQLTLVHRNQKKSAVMECAFIRVVHVCRRYQMAELSLSIYLVP